MLWRLRAMDMKTESNMENELKVGDRVRFTREDCHWIEIPINNGDEGVVVGNGSGYFHNSVDVNFGGVSDEISADDLELIEPYDPKAAFLSELKGLLEKYDAKMSADVSGPDLDCAEIDMLFVIGDDEIRFDVSMFNSFITPDNIIESAYYDKE